MGFYEFQSHAGSIEARGLERELVGDLVLFQSHAGSIEAIRLSL